MFRNRRVIGLEVVLQAEGPDTFRYTLLELEKGIVSITKKGSVQGLEELQQQLPENVPVVLVISGRGIVHKSLSLPIDAVDDKVIAGIMPSLKPEAFYVQRYEAEDSSVVSLARRQHIDQLLEKLLACKYPLIAASFGPFVLTHLLTLLEEDTALQDQLILEGYRLELGEYRIRSCRPVVEGEGDGTMEFRLGDERVAASHILTYAAAFGNLVSLPSPVSLSMAAIQQAASERRHQQVFRLFAAAALAFFFFVLLGNFLLFGWLSERNAALQTQMGENSSSLHQLSLLEQETEEKRQFLTVAGWLNSPKLSFYADRLAASVPEGIRLQELSIHPYKEQASKEQKKDVFDIGTVLVLGSCRDPLVLNRWIRALSAAPWIAKVENQNYLFDEASREGKFAFHVQLKEERGDQ